VLTLLPVFEKKILIFFDAEQSCILGLLKFYLRVGYRQNQHAFIGSFAPFGYGTTHRSKRRIYF
jgi:hypothetical protein